MIDLITPDMVPAYSTEIEAMHRLRHRVFKERLGWDVKSHDGMERDEFDDYAPTYLLAGDEEVMGSWRLLPTTGSYMLADVFSELLEGAPVPRDPSIWEASRFSVEIGTDGEDGLAAISAITWELCCGIVEFGIANGITEFVTVYDIRVARLMSRLKHYPTWRSRGHRVGNTIAYAGRFDINEAVLAKLRAASGITQSVIRPSRVREAA